MARPRSAAGTVLTTLPSMARSPLVGRSSPAIMRSSVDLPQPDGPTKTTNSPSSISRLMSWMTSTAPNDFFTLVSLIWPMEPPYFSPVPAMPVVMKRCRKMKTSTTGIMVTTVMARMKCHCTFSSPE